MYQNKPSHKDAPLPKATRRLRLCIVNTENRKKEGFERTGDNLKRVLSGLVPCETVVVHHTEASPETMAKINPAALVLTGQGTPWWDYSVEELEPSYRLLWDMRYPTLGICGGHQLMAKAFSATVAPMSERKRNAPGYEGFERERGFVPLKVVRADPLMKGIPEQPVFWQNHAEEVKTLPSGFVFLVHGRKSTIQAMRHQKARLYGVQFHPERFTDEHDHGKQLLQNFLRMSVP